MLVERLLEGESGKSDERMQYHMNIEGRQGDDPPPAFVLRGRPLKMWSSALYAHSTVLYSTRYRVQVYINRVPGSYTRVLCVHNFHHIILYTSLYSHQHTKLFYQVIYKLKRPIQYPGTVIY